MEGLTFIALVVLIILIVSIKNQLLTKIDELSRKIDYLKKQLSQFNSAPEKKVAPAPEKPKATEEIKKEEPLPFIIKEAIIPPPKPIVKEKSPVAIINDVKPRD